MNPFFEKMFKGKNTAGAKNFLNKVSEIAKLSEEVNTKKEQLHDREYSLMMEKKDEMFLSLSDFLQLMDISDLNITDIMSRCKHISELVPGKSSTITVYPIVENEHVVLCPDVNECKQHKGFKGESIKIVSVRR